MLALVAILVVNVQAQYREQPYKMSKVVDLISELYVDTVNTSKIVETGIIAMLKELDPHSVYISKDEVKEMNEPLEGNFEGIGIQFNILNDTLMVVGVIPSGPSERVGLMAGDKILNIDEENVAGMGLTNKMVMERLRGKKGTIVNVDIKRGKSSELLHFRIVRDKIPIYSVDAAYMADKENNIGYIKINKFAATTTQEYKKAIDGLVKEGMKHLILDLTDNGGGYLSAGFDLANQFLSWGQTVVTTKGTKIRPQVYSSNGLSDAKYGKLVVMINENSASASEIVSGAIQDWDRGVLVGRRTFGKGLVQNQFPLNDGSMIRLTVARYYTPTGRCIQRPYNDGVDEYEKEFIERYNSGELVNADSIHLSTTEKYYTLVNGREVYGGGGIMPDIFVPIDTTFATKYYSQMVRKGIFNKFVLTYVNNNREKLEGKYKSKNGSNFEKFKKDFVVTDKFLQDLVDFATKEKLKLNESEYERSKEHMRVNLKAAIARDLFDSGEFYQIINSVDPIYNEAIEVIKNDNLYNAKLNP